jgi:hypothetical protein
MATKKDIILTDDSPVTTIEEVAEYKILVDFKGSQTGATITEFTAGEIAELSASLATVALSEGWAEAL